MAVSKELPTRRKSIAVPNQDNPTIAPKAKRRAQSIAPGDRRLSPLAKARRSLAPRKSILKAFTNLLHPDDGSLASQSQPQSQTQSQSLISSADDVNATQSMDLTNDFHAPLQDNNSRQSLGGRRVSFARSVHIRYIEGKNDKNANGVQSSDPPSSDSSGEPQKQTVTDENAYPGAGSGSRRRSSVRYSLADSEGEDMDLTTIGPSRFIQSEESAIEDEDHGGGYDDMDVTEVIHGDFIRKRSLSIGLRRPLAQVSQGKDAVHPSDDSEQSQSFAEDDSQDFSDDNPDHSQVMEFTMPLKRSLRPPVEHDEVWHALRQATHSGDTPIEPEQSSDDETDSMLQRVDGMELDDAVRRLMRARESLPSVGTIQTTKDGTKHDESPQDNDTFSNSDSSFEDGPGNDGHTMNVSMSFGRPSIGGPRNTRMSIGYNESTMDESEIYGAIVQPTQSTPRHSTAHPSLQPQPTADKTPAPSLPTFTVFQPPPSEVISNPLPTSLPHSQPTIPIPFSFTPKTKALPTKKAPSSPSKTFSAAFAPPVTRPTPKKTTSPAKTSPKKRPRQVDDDGTSDTENMDSDRPSPAKRQTIAGKWPVPPASNSNVPSTTFSPKPKPLSPSKKAPFQGLTTDAPTQRPSSSLRRPSGYFARRKSLGVGLGTKPAEDETSSTTVRSSPKKKAGLGLGRLSMGSGSSDAWTRFDKNAGPIADVKGGGKDEAHCVRETSRQAIAVPNPTRGSPSPRPSSPAPLRPPAPQTRPSLPSVPAVDISTLLGLDEFGENEAEEMDMDMDPTEQWRGDVEPGGFVDEDESPISIEQFFSMTGIKFMDELTAPRRSTHPSQQPMRQARKPSEIPLAEYVTAMGIEVPQLVLYSRVSKDLEAWVEKSKADFAQAEDEAAKITPELFTEYSRADEEGQAELLHQLQLIRTNTRGLAKSDWYDWKLQWLEGLRTTADGMFKSLETDAKVLEGIKASADELIPTLQQEYEDIMRELEKESAEVAEIEGSDQEYLNELKASIAEQNIEVEALQAEAAEGRAQLLWLREKMEEADSQKQELRSAIADAQRILHIQKHSTRSEIFRLKDELEALEDLHMFRATKVNTDLFEYVHASTFRVSIPCKSFVPIVGHVAITRVDKTRTKSKDDFPRLSDFFLQAARQQIVQGGDLTIRQIVHWLSDYWSSIAQLRSQLKLLTIKYPLEIEYPKAPRDRVTSFTAKAMVLFPSVKAKAFISFVFSTEAFCRWPMSIFSLACEVEAIYGPIDCQTILKAVKDRLGQASPADNYACLLDACIEAQDIYH